MWIYRLSVSGGNARESVMIGLANGKRIESGGGIRVAGSAEQLAQACALHAPQVTVGFSRELERQFLANPGSLRR